MWRRNRKGLVERLGIKSKGCAPRCIPQRVPWAQTPFSQGLSVRTRVSVSQRVRARAQHVRVKCPRVVCAMIRRANTVGT